MDMFQKSGKVLRKILKTEKIKVFAVKFFLLLIQCYKYFVGVDDCSIVCIQDDIDTIIFAKK